MFNLFTPLQLTPSEEAFLRNYAGVVHSQMSQLPQHNIDQGKALCARTHAHTHTHTHADTHADTHTHTHTHTNNKIVSFSIVS